MRARGLKLNDMATFNKILQVAPHAGAWIETSFIPFAGGSMPSRPMRARGLKLVEFYERHKGEKSRPMRARGLKPQRCRGRDQFRRRAPCGRVD